MAKMPELERLYGELTATTFAFLGRGQHELTDIYSAVQRRFPSLCDNNYLCAQNCKHGHPEQPEWKHTTRSALNSLRKLGKAASGTHRGAWILNGKGKPRPSRSAEPPRPAGRAGRKRERNRSRGAGFGSPAENKRVEQAAMRYVTRYYRDLGWNVRDVSVENRGYDLLCEKRSTRCHVEVKGASGDSTQFIITAREAQTWRSDARYVLMLVTNALSKKPSFTEFVGLASRREFMFDPLSYWAKHRGLTTRSTATRKSGARRQR